jgi:hypothetical protein
LSNSVVDGFFFLLNLKFKDAGNFRFAGTDFWGNYFGRKHCKVADLKKVWKANVRPGIDQKLFVPCLITSNHFVLIVLDLVERHVDLYDPLDKTYDKDVEHFCQRLDKVFPTPPPEDHEEWTFDGHHKDSFFQRQNDSHSCAAFTCWYAYQLSHNFSIATWTSDWGETIKEITENIFISLIQRNVSL